MNIDPKIDLEGSKNSTIGLVSLILSCINIFLFFIMISLSAYAGYILQGDKILYLSIAIIFIAIILLGLVSLSLGIAGTLNGSRKKTFSKLGLIFSIVTLIVNVSMMYISVRYF